jgi:hypothetical protein
MLNRNEGSFSGPETRANSPVTQNQPTTPQSWGEDSQSISRATPIQIQCVLASPLVTGAAAAPQLRLFRRQGCLPAATHSTPPSPYLPNPSARAGSERGGGSGQWGSRVPAGAGAGAAAPMAEDADNRLEVDELLSIGDELVALLNSSKHGEDVAQAGANARMLRSVCRSELDNLELQLKGPVF